MRIVKMMEKMEVQHGGMRSQKLRELMSFHLKMGKTEEETMILVADKAEDVRTMQGNSRQQYIDQTMVYMWLRYRDCYPMVVAHKTHS
ncbi:hypothetical protein [Hafnia paralvei]|uniref:hypothetical protein n=1 Tax=Hafnia paralvei TaxID=546367 RepID=UPI0010346B1B|nr:hypothetical protein [Hafnia paralvei]TBL61143.1 hypothetical protein EYY97_11810 [Hafnia paralvei]